MLDLIEEQLQEEILFLPSELVATAFGDTNTIEAEKTDRLLQLFVTSGQFKNREAVEADETSVQALPVVVVRNRSGHVLRLKRKSAGLIIRCTRSWWFGPVATCAVRMARTAVRYCNVRFGNYKKNFD